MVQDFGHWSLILPTLAQPPSSSPGHHWRYKGLSVARAAMKLHVSTYTPWDFCIKGTFVWELCPGRDYIQ
jgi:hypothetical protein